MGISTFTRMLLCGVLSAALCATAAEGAERSNVRGIGMARTFVALSRGLDAAGINPACLGAPDSGIIAFSVVPVGVHVGSEFLDYDLYNSYFTGVETDGQRVGRYLSTSDKEKILSAFQTDVARSSAEAELRLFGFLLRLGRTSSLAFTVTEQLGVVADIPRDYMSFLFNGNLPGSQFDFAGTRVKASWRRDYAFSFGARVAESPLLGALSIGAAAKLVQGYWYYEVERFNTRLITANNGTLTGTVDFLARQVGGRLINGNSDEGYNLFPEAAGSGVGFDIGMASQVTRFFSFGVSVTDIGRVRWSKEVEEVRAESTMVVDDPLDANQRDAIESVIKGKRNPGTAFTTGLPTTLRVGVALAVHKLPAFGAMPGELLVGLDYNQGLRELPGTTKKPRASIGLEYKPNGWVLLRSGVSLGGTDHFNVAFGVGVHVGPFGFDIASENTGWLFAPKSFSHGSLAAGMQIAL